MDQTTRVKQQPVAVTAVALKAVLGGRAALTAALALPPRRQAAVVVMALICCDPDRLVDAYPRRDRVTATEVRHWFPEFRAWLTIWRATGLVARYTFVDD